MKLIEAVDGLTLCAMAAAGALWLPSGIRGPVLLNSAEGMPLREALLRLNRQTKRVRAGTWCAAAAAMLTVGHLWLLR